MKPKTTWILIADGTRARVLEYKGPGIGLNEVDGLEFADAHLKAQDIMADKAGRSMESSSPGRSAMELPTDPVKDRHAEFLAGIVDVLDEKLRQKKFDKLVVAAAPQALGQLRKALTPQLQSVVEAELDKDLTQIPNGKIGAHFEDVLAL